MRTPVSPRIRERWGSSRLRRVAGIAAVSVLAAAGPGAAVTSAEAGTASSAVEREVGGRETAGMICGPAAAFGAHALRCVRGPGFFLPIDELRPTCGHASVSVDR